MSASPPRPPLSAEIGKTLKLAAPLAVNNLAIASTHFADTVMAGRLGPQALAAVAVGGSVWMLAVLFAMGTLMALSPLVAHARGAGEAGRAGPLFRQALWLGVLLAAGLGGAAAAGGALLSAAGVAPGVVPVASGYLLALATGAPGLVLFFCLRFVSEGNAMTRPVMLVAVAGAAVNIFGNWVLMFGNLGMPALGVVGCGLSSAISMWCMAALMTWLTGRGRAYRALALWRRPEAPNPALLVEIVRLGVPIAVTVVAEAGLFASAAILIGTLGAAEVAAHQIGMSWASLMFMLPLAFASATTVRVGEASGARDGRGAARSAGIGIALCGGFMLLSAAVLVVARPAIVALYTDDAAVAVIAVELLAVAAMFQLADGLQVGAMGALRGYRDTRVPMVLTLVAYWGIGFPLAYGLGVVRAASPVHVWYGLVAGLAVACCLLLARLSIVSRRGGARTRAPAGAVAAG